MTIDGQLMRGLFEHERLKPAELHTDKGNFSQNSIGIEKSDKFRYIHLTFHHFKIRQNMSYTSTMQYTLFICLYSPNNIINMRLTDKIIDRNVRDTIVIKCCSIGPHVIII